MTATPNRLAPYLSEPQKIVMPGTREGREVVLADAVFAAIAALQGLLAHPDPKVVMRAAEMILNLETTRQRHGRVMIGLDLPQEQPVFAATERSGRASTAPAGRGEERTVNRANPLDEFIEKVRKELRGPDTTCEIARFPGFPKVVSEPLQAQEDAGGTGVVVSRAQAEECARHIHANAHRTPPFDSAPPNRGCH
jgi:hypothetical protein